MVERHTPRNAVFPAGSYSDRYENSTVAEKIRSSVRVSYTLIAQQKKL